jgi:hypothetical protein
VGKAGAGCGAFGLVSLLLGVGLVAFLGSRVLTDLGGDESSSKATTGFRTAALRVAPASPWDDGDRITVSAPGFEPGSEVRITTCLGQEFATLGSLVNCSASGAVVVTADDAGAISGEYPVARVVVIDGDRYDCAASPGACSIVAAPPSSADRTASAPLVLAPGPPVDATIPPS